MAALATIAAIGSLVLAAAGTAYGIASQPSTPKVAPPKPPPIPPGAPEPPPPAPTTTQEGRGPARVRREQSRRFGVQQTLLTNPLGSMGTVARAGAGTTGGTTAGPTTLLTRR